MAEKIKNMRTFRFIVLFLLLNLPFNTYAQTTWDDYEIGKVFSLSIPSTMTLRNPDSVVGKSIDKAKKKFFLQYGMQTPDWSYAFIPAEGVYSTKYARILVSVNRQNSITQKMVKEATEADLQDVKDARIEEARQFGQTLKNLTIKKEVYDGKYALVLRYERPGLSGDVHVDYFNFFLLNKQIEVTISYRVSEAAIWKKDFSLIPSTFSFE